jgi:hypothetical protein
MLYFDETPRTVCNSNYLHWTVVLTCGLAVTDVALSGLGMWNSSAAAAEGRRLPAALDLLRVLIALQLVSTTSAVLRSGWFYIRHVTSLLCSPTRGPAHCFGVAGRKRVPWLPPVCINPHTGTWIKWHCGRKTEDSAPVTLNPATGYDPEPVQSTSNDTVSSWDYVRWNGEMNTD